MRNSLRGALAIGLATLLLLSSCPVLGEGTTPDEAAPGIVVSPVTGEEELRSNAPLSLEDLDIAGPSDLITEKSRYFVRSGYVRRRKVEYYDNVYCYNHKEYVYTPFSSDVPEEYFVVDSTGVLAIAPLVLDITDAMREALYGGDVGITGMLYGQYCERIKARDGRIGFSGIHEGIDFLNEEGCDLFSILGGKVTRAGDQNGTVAIYNETYDVTVIYLHCRKIAVKIGDVVEAGTKIGVEGDKKSASPYTHVEVRFGQHKSSNSYRDVFLQSDVPYAVMQKALNVSASGREPVTAAAITRAEDLRRQAEEDALRQAEEEAAQEAADNTPDEDEILEEEPDDAPDGYGFAEDEDTTGEDENDETK